MAVANEGYHEPVERLRAETMDHHRAITSLMEELEAVDWYDQRVDATDDDELRAILAHNRDEEKEHAAMVLEWLRRNDPTFDEQLRTYLYSDGPITEVESEAMSDAESAERPSATTADSLGMGNLRGEELQ